jgi:hypothetical protein
VERSQRDAAKAAYDKAFAQALSAEITAKNWNAQQIAEFDECFPSFGALRQASSTPAAAPK